jgi:hypothetical protein
MTIATLDLGKLTQVTPGVIDLTVLSVGTVVSVPHFGATKVVSCPTCKRNGLGLNELHGSVCVHTIKLANISGPEDREECILPPQDFPERQLVQGWLWEGP